MSDEGKAAGEGTLGTDGEAAGVAEKETPPETDQGSNDAPGATPGEAAGVSVEVTSTTEGAVVTTEGGGDTAAGEGTTTATGEGLTTSDGGEGGRGDEGAEGVTPDVTQQDTGGGGDGGTGEPGESASPAGEATIQEGEATNQEDPGQEAQQKEEEATVTGEQATDEAEPKQPDSGEVPDPEGKTEQPAEEGEVSKETGESPAKADTELEAPKQDPESTAITSDMPQTAAEDQEPLPQPVPPEGELVVDREERADSHVIIVDGTEIHPEEPDEEEKVPTPVVVGESREELMEKIMLAAEEKDRLEALNAQIQADIADYLARKRDDERADPGRSVIDHEKKYLQSMSLLEGVQDELERVKQQNEARDSEMLAERDRKMEELAQAKADFVKCRREKVLNVVDPRTGRKMTAKILEEYQESEEKKEKEIVQVRLAGIKLQNKISKLEALIKQKEQLVGGLHLIDFEQLRINNVDLNEKVEERKDEILKLKKKVTSTVEVLTHVKEKLQFLQVVNTQKKEELREIEAVVAKNRDHLTRLKRTRDTLRSDNLRLRQKGGLVGHTSLLRDFEEKQDQSKEMYEKLESLQKRQAELSIMCEGLKKKIEQAKYVSNQV